ncbi:MAG: pilus assembly protein [Endomicrobia bacterium]|nr:pilus assembly protein [Endomicrobiia bacterium]
MFVRTKINNKKGQALVELALIAPLIVFFLFTIMWFGRLMLTWQQLVGAARYGTDLIAYTPYNEAEIKADIINYLCNPNNIGRTLDPDALGGDNIKIKISRFSTIDFTILDFGDKDEASFDSFIKSFNPMHYLDMVKTTFDFFIESVSPDMSCVEISYKYKVPPILLAVPGNILPESFTIKVKSEVLAGTGSPGENKRQA